MIVLMALVHHGISQHIIEMNEEVDPEEEMRQNKFEQFVNRITKDEEFPLDTLQNIIVANMKEHDRINQNELTESKLVQMYSQDQHIKDLILL